MTAPVSEPRCTCCGKPWIDHPVAEAMCEKLNNAERDIAQLRTALGATLDQLESVVITDGCDAGVLLKSCESPTYYSDSLKGHVYDNEYFSQMGESLVAIADHVKSALDKCGVPAVGHVPVDTTGPPIGWAIEAIGSDGSIRCRSPGGEVRRYNFCPFPADGLIQDT